MGSIVSLVGGVILIWRERLAKISSPYLVSFAAGVLLAAAFLDLLPEAYELIGSTDVFLYALIGVIIFFFVERFLLRVHHHGRFHDLPPVSSIVLVGDAIHNFIDGIVIASAFLVNVPLGVVTSLAIVSHEIPQEIGDFGILLKGGMKPKKVLFVNFAAATFTLFGAILAYVFSFAIEPILAFLLAFGAGTFIYIAASDLIPEIHHGEGTTLSHSLLLVTGAALIFFLIRLAE